MEKVAISYSGGKDSAYSLYKIISEGMIPVCLIVSMKKDSDISWTHNLKKEKIEEISRLLQIPIIYANCSIDNYELKFEDALKIAIGLGAKACVFGDIDIQKHIDWNNKRTENVGIKAIHPLYKMNHKKLIYDFINAGFIAQIIKVNKQMISENYLGKIINKNTVEQMISENIDVCGENGEYHTIVEDGPIFIKEVYLDNASTSFPKAPGTGDIVKNFIDERPFNINRGNYKKAYENAFMVMETKEKIAKLINCQNSNNIIFNSGATESINQFIQGSLKKEDIIAIAPFEHNAVMRGLKDKFSYLNLPFNTDFKIDFNKIEQFFCKKEINVVVISHASNLSGDVMQIEKLGKLCKKHNIIFCVDASQTAGIYNIDVQKYNIDFLILAPHISMMAPQGIGAYYIGDKLIEKTSSFKFGGNGSFSNELNMPDILPDKYEVGSLNLSGIAALEHCLAYINTIGVDCIKNKRMRIRNYFIDNLKDIPNIQILGNESNLNIGIVSINFKNYDNSMVAFMLDNDFNVMTRVGLHCNVSAHKYYNSFPDGAIRFSFSYFNSLHEILYTTNCIKKILIELK